MNKDTLIYCLTSHFPLPVSKETLSQQLHITLSQLDTAVDDLSRHNVPVRLSSHGYTLDYPLYSKTGITHHLQTTTIGHQLILLDQIDSTHLYVRKHLSHFPHGSIVLAYTQTAGRGRLGRTWSSPFGKSVSLSIVLTSPLTQMNPLLITQLTAAALLKALLQYTDCVEIKWPNDILLNRHKVSGILTEAIFDGQTLEALLIGVGINLHQSHSHFPPDLQSKATSLFEHTEHFCSPDALIGQFLTLFERFYIDYTITGQSHAFLELCRQYSAIIGRRVLLIQGGHSRQVVVDTIDDAGQLIVLDVQTGRKETVLNAEVSIRHTDGQCI